MYRIISCTLFVFFHVSVAEDGLSRKYSHYDYPTSQHLLCDQCPPGTYVKHDCTTEEKTECSPCPFNHYADTWNSDKECTFCSTVCKELQFEKQECNGTHSRVCECTEGHYLELEFCLPHRKCPPGFFVLKSGTPDSDTVCGECPKGTFSNVTSANAACQKQTDCKKLGLKMINKKHSKQDAECEEHTQESTYHCEIDVTLCEEALFRSAADRPGKWLSILAEWLPCTRVTMKQIECIKQLYEPQDHAFYLFKLWKDQNMGHFSSKQLFPGIQMCENRVLKHIGNFNFTVKDLVNLTQSLPGKKLEKEDVENILKTCERPKQILKLFNLWRIKNDGNTLKDLNLLKTSQLQKILRRRVKRLKTFLNSDSMYRAFQKIILEIISNKKKKTTKSLY
ncbi:tumor necrosis factor receptor superfamily member 11B [Spea bombifrons]|uniref:tumor necrosis factor receptor superfamily member 11B n=1 Tax=Spea bombifrons TaxID=233779 RepID=UPI00234B2384|nr:tumor necrosis factor receptor superfamily member 11B [Spea bombifrons]